MRLSNSQLSQLPHLISNILQQFDGFFELVFGAYGFEAWEAGAVELDVVAIAGEHEALALQLDAGDVCFGGVELESGAV